MQRVFEASGVFPGLDLLLAIPEHQVPLPGGARPSQNDIWALARYETGLVSIAVEGKVAESFGPTLGEWLRDASPGKLERLDFIRSILGLSQQLPDDSRYQLFHRTASALLEARRFHAKSAVVLIQSFDINDTGFPDFASFVSLFGATAVPGKLVSAGMRHWISMYFGWVRGDSRYLTEGVSESLA